MAIQHGLCINVGIQFDTLNERWMNGATNNIAKPNQTKNTPLSLPDHHFHRRATDSTKHAIQQVFDTHSNHALQIASYMNMKKKEATISFFSHFFFSDIMFFIFELNEMIECTNWFGGVRVCVSVCMDRARCVRLSLRVVSHAINANQKIAATVTAVVVQPMEHKSWEKTAHNFLMKKIFEKRNARKSVKHWLRLLKSGTWTNRVPNKTQHQSTSIAHSYTLQSSTIVRCLFTVIHSLLSFN